MKRSPPCNESSGVRLGKAEVLSLAGALVAALFLGMALMLSSAPEVFSLSPAGPSAPQALSGQLNERPPVVPATEPVQRLVVAPAPPPVRPLADSAVLREENRRLQQENQQLQTQLKDVLAWVLANFRGKYPLPEPYMSKLRVVPVNEDYTLNRELAEFLRVTPEEEQSINESLRTASQVIHAIETATMTVRSPRPDKVILSVPAFAQEGRLLKEDLYADLEGALGSPRFDRLIQVAEQDLKASFYHFGEASRTMIFELAHSDGQETAELIIRDAWIVPDGLASRTIEAHESTVTNLPAHYRTYMAWLPDYVARFSVE